MIKGRQKPESAVQHLHTGTNTNESTSESETSEYEILFRMKSSQKCTLNPPKAKTKTGNCKIDVIGDTGASINILDTPSLNKIQTENPKLQLDPSTSNVFAYALDTPFGIAGKFETEIETPHREILGTFYVAKKSTGNLLSVQTVIELN